MCLEDRKEVQSTLQDESFNGAHLASVNQNRERPFSLSKSLPQRQSHFMISWDCIIQVLGSSYPPTISGLGVIPIGGEVLRQPLSPIVSLLNSASCLPGKGPRSRCQLRPWEIRQLSLEQIGQKAWPHQPGGWLGAKIQQQDRSSISKRAESFRLAQLPSLWSCSLVPLLFVPVPGPQASRDPRREVSLTQHGRPQGMGRCSQKYSGPNKLVKMTNGLK